MTQRNSAAIKQPPTLRLHLWLETSDGLFFGIGRAQLLAKVDEYGSLKKAADELGMSYRAAWGKIKKTETVVGAKLIARCGNRRDGYELTEFGRTLLEGFNTWYHEMEHLALEKARKLFPWPIESFDEATCHAPPPASKE
ncbi:winged helix-turn-helix domain-containing protein [Desulfoferrobacter suflitae]|uniref:winged helix-turn-helix domain-containing protein n=1 Tax=Desulfoferrobacter suflitae TaxID=2865782 RepID=UPI00216466AF|nr:LysR family transcriptional regulator [Desulfoferrobacter suflitae]MCK8602801.1 LysR family transcriptional regulator [Desulfoferrobacter suflitae]